MIIIPAIGKPFEVTFTKFTDKFRGVITNADPEANVFTIHQTKRVRFDAVGAPYTLPDAIIEVEANWFDSELTGRHVKELN